MKSRDMMYQNYQAGAFNAPPGGYPNAQMGQPMQMQPYPQQGQMPMQMQAMPSGYNINSQYQAYGPNMVPEQMNNNMENDIELKINQIERKIMNIESRLKALETSNMNIGIEQSDTTYMI
ncbi:MAG: hypothetical protein RR228_00465 [Bacilli bacterium]